jgi:hypothetical protein
MRVLRFPIALILASVALLLGLFAVGSLAAGTALAGGPPFAGPPWAWRGGQWAGGGPAGVGVAPFDEPRDGRPFTLELTPGTVTAASRTGLTVQTTDGAHGAFTVDARTHLRAGPADGDRVVVIAENGAPGALAVFGPRGQHGRWGGAR